jgi:hypothetical protein
MQRDPNVPARTKWIARLLVGLVLLSNAQCALVFLIAPVLYVPGFELTGLPGEVMVRGMGLLFLMWCIPYLVAVSDPLRHWVSLAEAVAMQALGLAGESWLVASLPPGHLELHNSGIRFILFDGVGVILLLGALALVRWAMRSR